MGKVQQFKHKPSAYEYGQYYYDNDSTDFEPIENSSGVQKPYNKYNKQSLETTVSTSEVRDKIIQDRLRRIGDSFIQINNLRIDNRGVNHKVKNTHFRGFLFDRNTFDCFNSGGNLKSYNQIDKALYKSRYDGDAGGSDTIAPTQTISFGNLQYTIDVVDESRLYDYTTIFNWDAPRYKKGKGPGNFDFLEDKIILQNLSMNDNPAENFKFDEINHASTFFSNISNYILDENSTNETGLTNNQPFNPMDNKTLTTDRFTSIFNENNENNYLQFVVWMRGDARRFIGTKKRRKGIAVVKISPSQLFDANITSLGPQRFDFTNAPHVYGGGGSTPAWKLSNISLTIDTSAGASLQDFELPDGTTLHNEILSDMQARLPILNSNFDMDFLKTTLYNENYSIRAQSGAPYNFRRDFTPVSELTIDNIKSINVQSYKTNKIDKQICSAPNIISLGVYLTRINNVEQDRILEKNYDYLGAGANIPPFYKFCVIDWDDKNDSIKSVDDYFDIKPGTYEDLLEKQNNNLFIFKDGAEKLTNVYKTSGLKKVKILLFSYIPYLQSGNIPINYSVLPPFDKIEILRYKLISSKIFLEPSAAEFQDFAEIGGEDYVTTPFNNTVPIIGGMDNDSNYKISIKKTLDSSNIMDSDVNEIRLLKDAIENDELGKSINKMDLEQCRYFNKSYSISELLNIDITTESEYSNNVPVLTFYNPTSTLADNQNPNTSPEYLATLPFPQYIEEFDFNGNGEIDLEDAGEWANYGLIDRPDISDYLFNLIGGLDNPTGNYYTYPDYVYNWNNVNNIPSGTVTIFNSHNDNYWDGETNKFPKESSIGQIFISDNQDNNLKQNCKLELNLGEPDGKSIYDSSGNGTKGILIGDYKVKKQRKGEPMRRDSFVKIPKKSNENGAL